jgi:hypothetical protein
MIRRHINPLYVSGAILAVIGHLVIAVGASASPSLAVSTLHVVPAEAHSGDTLYLSGSGFRPNSQLAVLTGCPNWFNAAPANTVVGGPGPVTDKRGHFVGFAIKALTLIGVTTSPCEIYVGRPQQGFSVDVPARYTILPAGQALSPCSAAICLTVKTAGPATVRIQGWPGAHVVLTVKASSGPKKHYVFKLDWDGTRTQRLALPATQQNRVHISAHAWLGPITGNSSTNLRMPASP